MGDVIEAHRIGQNKEIAKQALEIMRRAHPDAKLGHAYDALARAYGYRDWNTASAKAVAFDFEILERFAVAWPHEMESE